MSIVPGLTAVEGRYMRYVYITANGRAALKSAAEEIKGKEIRQYYWGWVARTESWGEVLIK
jgi:hypothetical protein